MSKIWIVQGSTGEYSDHCEWIVGWYSNERDAQICVEFLSKLAREAFKLHKKGAYEAAGNLMAPFDLGFMVDYTGTNYACFPVEPGKDFSTVKLTKSKLKTLLHLGNSEA